MQARSIRVRPPARVSSRHRIVAVAAALALVVAACGEEAADGDAAGIAVEDGTDAGADDAVDATDAGSDTDATTAAPDADADAEASTDTSTSEDAETEDPATSGGPNEHRPPPAGEPDCPAVTASPPGAIISFPSDDDPSWLDAGPGPVTVEVVGCSDSFEANIQYDAFHGQNTTPTLSGFTEGGTLGNWGAFSFDETYWTPGDWTVVIFVDDAASGDRVEYDEVTFTVS